MQSIGINLVLRPEVMGAHSAFWLVNSVSQQERKVDLN